jgi:glycosyltransferase involved in cell wall biosynthesis
MSKILFVSNTTFFIYNFVFDLVRQLKDDGNEVVVVAQEDDYSENFKTDGYFFVPIHCLSRKSANPIKDIRFFLELYKIYKHEKPDVVLHFTIKPNVYGTFAAIFAKTFSICTVTGLGWLFTKKTLVTNIGSFLYRILYRIAFFYSQYVLFLNNDDRGYFIEHGLVKKGKAFITPGSGVDTETFSPLFCRQFQEERQNFVFLLISRMLWDKGISEFVNAAGIVRDKHPSVEFWLLGPYDYENRSAIPETAIKKWEDEGMIKYLGKTYDVRSYICQSDVIVLPSYYREGIPTVLLEAMAMEKPIITTDNVGCREVVEDGLNGLLIPVKDAEALAGAMVRMLTVGEGIRKKMGQSGREKVIKEYDRKLVTKIYLDLISKTLQGR